MLSGLYLAVLIKMTSSFLIRSYVPPSARCNATAGTACFTELYSMMEETCSDQRLNFRCVHYNFLEECFEARVGKCWAEAVGQFASAGFKVAESQCETRKRSRKASDGVVQLVSRPRDALSTRDVITSLGYLQVQCSISRHKNCSSDHVNNIMNQCEEHMKPKAGFSHFDRHRLLRIKLDTSKKLMMYDETDKERECLVVRSIFSEIFTLHQTHCHHSIVTRCLCERLRFDQLCGIDCGQLEATAPNQNQLAWDEWKRARLIRSSAILSWQIYFVIVLSIMRLLL